MTRRDEQTKIKCLNANGVEKMLMPSVVKNEAKKSNGFRPVKESSVANSPSKIGNDANNIVNKKEAEHDEECTAEIIDETAPQEKKKPGRKAKK